MWGDELSALYASVGVVVGDSAEAAAYWSDRLPVTLSRGGLLCHPQTVGMDRMGFTDEVMVTFPRFGFRELGEKLDALSLVERRQRSDAAVDLIRDRHLWDHRLLELQRVVFGSGRARRHRGGRVNGEVVRFSAGAAATVAG